MPLSINTLGASNIEFSKADLEFEVTDKDSTHDEVLVFAEYGQQSDLSDGQRISDVNDTVVTTTGTGSHRVDDFSTNTSHYFRSKADAVDFAVTQSVENAWQSEGFIRESNIYSNQTGMETTVGSQTAMDVVAASQTAMDAVSASQTAMETIVGVSTAEDSLAANKKVLAYNKPAIINQIDKGTDDYIEVVATQNGVDISQYSVQGGQINTGSGIFSGTLDRGEVAGASESDGSGFDYAAAEGDTETLELVDGSGNVVDSLTTQGGDLITYRNSNVYVNGQGEIATAQSQPFNRNQLNPGQR